MVADRITNTERQLNLTYALMLAGDRGLSMVQIARTVPGYGYTSSLTPKLKKLLKRDMDDIRESGIEIHQSPLQTKSDSKTYAYAIAENSFEWPTGFELNSNQTRLLELAASCWHEVSMDRELNYAMTRVVALGEAPDRSQMRELLPSFRPMDASFGPLAEAIQKQQRVRIKYRKAGAKRHEAREFSPWKFLNIEGEWIIQGWSHKAPEGFRNFLLKRIVDKNVEVLEGKDLQYRGPVENELEDALEDLNRFRDDNIAVIRVTQDTAAWSHFEMEFERDDIKTLRYMDIDLLAATLRRFANQIEVLSPDDLKASIKSGLERLVADHA